MDTVRMDIVAHWSDFGIETADTIDLFHEKSVETVIHTHETTGIDSVGISSATANTLHGQCHKDAGIWVEIANANGMTCGLKSKGHIVLDIIQLKIFRSYFVDCGQKVWHLKLWLVDDSVLHKRCFLFENFGFYKCTLYPENFPQNYNNGDLSKTTRSSTKIYTTEDFTMPPGVQLCKETLISRNVVMIWTIWAWDSRKWEFFPWCSANLRRQESSGASKLQP